MSISFKSFFRTILLACCVASLAACGGGGGGDDDGGGSSGSNSGSNGNGDASGGNGANGGSRTLTADAGADEDVLVGTRLSLDGSNSRVSDGATITYSWSLESRPAASGATLSDVTSARPAFTADVAGDYVIELVVSSGSANSRADQVTITASRNNTRPTANAGRDQNVTTGDPVTLNGSGSRDADGDRLSYRWRFVSRAPGSDASFSNAAAPSPSFAADTSGDYVIGLTVNDGTQASGEDRLTVTAVDGNSAPMAVAGPDQDIAVNRSATLNGRNSSDADGDSLSYAWRIVGRPQGSTASLSNENSVSPELMPDLVGDYVVELAVSDGQENSTDRVVISAGPVLSLRIDRGDPQDGSPNYALADRTAVVVRLDTDPQSASVSEIDRIQFGRIRLDAIGRAFTIDDLRIAVTQNSSGEQPPRLSVSGLNSGDTIVEGRSTNVVFTATDIAVPGDYLFAVDFTARETGVAYQLRFLVSLTQSD